MIQEDTEHSEACHDNKIAKEVILVAPILLSNQEIKEAEDEDLIMHRAFEGYTQQRPLCVRGLPVETGENTPLIFLVPHLSMQQFNFAVSLINISGTLNQLLMASWVDS